MSKMPEFLRRRSEITGFFVRKIFMSNEIWGKEELLKSPYKKPAEISDERTLSKTPADFL